MPVFGIQIRAFFSNPNYCCPVNFLSHIIVWEKNEVVFLLLDLTVGFRMEKYSGNC